MKFDTAKRLAAAISSDDRIITSINPAFTHLFFVPDFADPHKYVNGVLAWSVRGPVSGFKVHYPINDIGSFVAVLVCYDPEKGYGTTYDLKKYLQQMQLICEYHSILKE